MSRVTQNANRSSKGEEAAYGPRSRLKGRVRSKVFAAVRRLEEHTHEGRRVTADYLDFTPGVRSRQEFVDISARMNWYLPESARAVPARLGGWTSSARLEPDEAWYMDPALLHDAGWSSARPDGRAHVVVHRLTPATLLRYLLHFRNATLVDHEVGFGIEEGYFRLHKRFGITSVPDAVTSVQRLLAKRVSGGSALVLATGPSAKLVDPTAVDHDVRVACNSVVRDHELIEVLQPDVIAFGDPVFHYGPSRYAAAFRKDLLRALEECSAVLLTTHLFVEPLVAHVPSVADRLAVLPLSTKGSWRWPSEDEPSARMTSNVLTNLMLPAAFALADHIEIAGCDGRDPSENYFWKHNPQTQYSDEMMRSVFEAHPAFFRDRDYADYYDEHCQQLEEFLVVAEAAGKTARGITPSHIPALRERGGPAFPVSAEAGK